MVRRRGRRGHSSSCCCAHTAVETEYLLYAARQLDNCGVLLDELGFTRKEGKKLWETFEVLDQDGGSSIDFGEFCDFFDLEKSPFTERCFLLLDRGATGQINFPQFVLCCWNYCTYDKLALAKFAYRLYDADNTGNIPVKQLFSMIEEIYDIHTLTGGRGMSDGSFNLIKNSPEFKVAASSPSVQRCRSRPAHERGEFIVFAKSTPMLSPRPPYRPSSRRRSAAASSGEGPAPP